MHCTTEKVYVKYENGNKITYDITADTKEQAKERITRWLVGAWKITRITELKHYAY